MSYTPPRTPTPTSKKRSAHPSSLPYTIQFIIGDIDGPASFPRKSVYMPSTLAQRSPYLRARILPPPPSQDIVNVVLTDTYYDALKLYKIWLQEGVVPKFRLSTTFPVATIERTFLWSECFDLIRAHITGTRFAHTEFEDYVMDELVRWLDPVQDADAEVIDFVFRERGVSKKLQSFVVDRMFADVEHVRRIFGMYLERIGKGRIGGFRLGRMCEYHAHDEGRCWASVEERKEERPRGRLLDKRDPVKIPGHWKSNPQIDEWRTVSSEDDECGSPGREAFFPPLSSSPKIHTSLLRGVALPKREAEERTFTDLIEPHLSSPSTPNRSAVFSPAASHLKTSTNQQILQQFSVRRKPLPRTSKLSIPDVEPNQGVAGRCRWPLSAVIEEQFSTTQIDFGAFKFCVERGRPKTRRSGRRIEERRSSMSRNAMPRLLVELQGRAVTPEELYLPAPRPGSAP